jgi:hypothetical protein
MPDTHATPGSERIEMSLGDCKSQQQETLTSSAEETDYR